MKYHVECECCGQTVKAYTHRLNKPMVQSFIKFVNQYKETRQPLRVGDVPDLTTIQYNSFYKLQHFGLIKKMEGGYLPTQRGLKFLRGEFAVQNPSASMGRKVLPLDHQAWETHSGNIKEEYIHDIDDRYYKQRDEYLDESSNQTSLL